MTLSEDDGSSRVYVVVYEDIIVTTESFRSMSVGVYRKLRQRIYATDPHGYTMLLYGVVNDNNQHESR